MSSFESNYNDIIENIKKLTNKKVEILVVSKYATCDQILQAYKQGIRHFGESRFQDAIKKINILNKNDINWHFIGHIQKNKAKKIITYFNTLQSIDSIELLNKVQNEANKINKKINIYLQINIANEQQKYGFNPDNFLNESPNPIDYPNIMINGIMVMLPKQKNKEKLKMYCQKASQIYQQIKEKIPTIKTFSMGMSQDYKICILYNSNQIRLGSALFKE